MKKISRNDSSKPRAVPGDLRRHNRGLVLEHLFRASTVSRTALVDATGLTPAAVSRITRELVEAGLVRELAHEGAQAARGRPQVDLELVTEGAYVIGIGVGAFEQWIRIADLRGDCVSRRSIQLLDQSSARAALRLLVGEIRGLLSLTRIPRRRVLGAGIASAGVVDRQKGLIIESPNLGWRDLPVAALVSDALGLPVVVESMHHALNLAEESFGIHAGINAGRPPGPGLGGSDTFLVNASMGIGASVMEEGRIVRGRHNAAGQIGHMNVPGATDLCTCGRRGCLDTVASGYGVLRRLGLVPPRRVAREHDSAAARKLLAAIERERQGEPRVRQAFQASGAQLGDALNAVRAILDPQRIVLTGPLSGTASYVKGVQARLIERGAGDRDAGGTPDPALLVLGTHTPDSAGACLALAEFAFGGSLDLSDLGLQAQ